MSTQIEDELRATFKAASDFVQPRSGLADRVRTTSRRRRFRLTAAVAAATACVLVAAGGGYVAVHSNKPAANAVSRQRGRVLITAPRGESIGGLFATGRYLYTETSGYFPPTSLSVYDRTSGRLIRRVQIDDVAVLAATGPGGSVWALVAPELDFGPAKVWLFSPDLRFRSVSPEVQSTVLLPLSRVTALIPVARGLLRLTLPAPGQPGHATEHLEPGTSLGRVASMANGWAAVLDGRVIVDVADRAGYDYHVVIAGHPNATYGDQDIPQEFAVAGGSLWFANAPGGPLVRLNSQLKPTTPRFVAADPVLRRVGSIWSANGTIWVSVASKQVAGGRHAKAPILTGPHDLFCFRAGTKDGPVVEMPLRGYPWDVAAAGRTVYVLVSARNGSQPNKVMSYQVPAACR
jgi:hypothetical protein